MWHVLVACGMWHVYAACGMWHVHVAVYVAVYAVCACGMCMCMWHVAFACGMWHVAVYVHGSAHRGPHAGRRLPSARHPSQVQRRPHGRRSGANAPRATAAQRAEGGNRRWEPKVVTAGGSRVVGTARSGCRATSGGAKCADRRRVLRGTVYPLTGCLLYLLGRLCAGRRRVLSTPLLLGAYLLPSRPSL